MQSFPHVEVDGQRRKIPIQRIINLIQIRYHLSDCTADLHEAVFLTNFGIDKNEHSFFKYKRQLGKDTEWTVVFDMRTRATFV